MLKYLTPEDARKAERWVEPLEPLKGKYPLLAQVDLVIEGGAGTGVTMAHISKRLFPDALYVGTDLSEMVGINKGGLYRSIDERALQEIMRTNEHPSLAMRGAMVLANCFDYDLVRDIAQKTGRQYPLLASYKALQALVDRKMNMWEKKDESDMRSIKDVANMDSPYIGQLHILYGGLWDDGSPSSAIEEVFYGLEAAAKNSGWLTDRLGDGLLLLRESYTP